MFNFVAIDDEEPELQEDVELTMTVTSGAATLGIQTVVVHILPSDLTYPVYEIIQVRGTDNQGVLDSIDTACELEALCRLERLPTRTSLHVDRRNPRHQRVQCRQRLRVRRARRGQREGEGCCGPIPRPCHLYADTVIYEAADSHPEPIQVQEMDEDTESRVVKLKCVRLRIPRVDQHPPYFDARGLRRGPSPNPIDANTDIFGEEPPLGTFGVTGIGGQADNGALYLDGYTLLPRSLRI